MAGAPPGAPTQRGWGPSQLPGAPNNPPSTATPGFPPAPPPGGWGQPTIPPPGGWGQPASGAWPGPDGAGSNYASFWARLGARIIDGLLLGVPFGVLVVLLLATLPKQDRFCTVNGELAICRGPSGGTIGVVVLVGLLWFVGLILYYVLRVGRSGATVGQKLLGIRVVDDTTGEVIGCGRAAGRWFMSAVSGWACYLGYLWMLWDNRRQTWHDKVVRSVVVKR